MCFDRKRTIFWVVGSKIEVRLRFQSNNGASAAKLKNGSTPTRHAPRLDVPITWERGQVLRLGRKPVRRKKKVDGEWNEWNGMDEKIRDFPFW